MDNQQASLKPVPGFRRYLISDSGTIYTTHNLRPYKTYEHNGYECVNLLRTEDSPGRGKYKTMLVHRLVAATFLGENPDLQVNHKDGNKLNNKVENLEWVTRSENMQHALASGLSQCVGENHHRAKLTESDVEAICKLLLESDLEHSEIAQRFNVSRQTITNITTKHRWVRVSDRYWLGKLQRLGASRRG